jgi:peptidoglycan-associated lipoprotein
MKNSFAMLLAFAAVSTALAAAQAPAAPVSDKPLRSEVALEYSYLRSNAPPGGCGCINLNGGSATYAWRIKPEGSIALVGEITAAHAGGISSSGYGLTLSAYTAGARYLPRLGHSSFQPFGQAMIGFAHDSGSLVEGQGSAASGAGEAFAANLGGGFDLRASHRFSIRLVEASYLLTTFGNGVNGRQNNLRLSAGVVLHFGN